MLPFQNSIHCISRLRYKIKHSSYSKSSFLTTNDQISKNIKFQHISVKSFSSSTFPTRFATCLYSTTIVPTPLSSWDKEDLAYLGTYDGVGTQRGLKKTTTGLAGIDVQPNGIEILAKLYQIIFQELEKFPPDYLYRTDQEYLVRKRLVILEMENDVIRAEEEIDDGSIEELIIDAENELHKVIPMLLSTKPWEGVKETDLAVPILFTEVP